MTISHSDRALQTMTLMGTAPDAWKGATVDMRKAVVPLPGDVPCPSCAGAKLVVVDADGNVVRRQPQTSEYPSALPRQQYDHSAWSEANRAFRAIATPCQTCRPRGRGRPTGKVRALVETPCWVATVLWPAGTLRDSRYEAPERCGLCGRPVLKTNLLPVVGVDAEGRPHGMLVGSDCAGRFLPGVTRWLTPEPKAKLPIVFSDEG